MATVKHSRSSSLYIRSTPSHQGGMTVGMLRDFVRALDAEGASDETTVAAQHSIETRHLIALSIRESTTEGVGEPGDEHPPEDGDAGEG